MFSFGLLRCMFWSVVRFVVVCGGIEFGNLGIKINNFIKCSSFACLKNYFLIVNDMFCGLWYLDNGKCYNILNSIVGYKKV